jgi:hypothetical protein
MVEMQAGIAIQPMASKRNRFMGGSFGISNIVNKKTGFRAFQKEAEKNLPVNADAFTFALHYESIRTYTPPSFLTQRVGCWCFVLVRIKH